MARFTDTDPRPEVLQTVVDEAADNMRRYIWGSDGGIYYTASLRYRVEFGGAFLWTKGVGVSFTQPVTVFAGDKFVQNKLNLGQIIQSAFHWNPGSILVGDYHTHPSGVTSFSGQDAKTSVIDIQNNVKLGLPYGSYVTSAGDFGLLAYPNRSIPFGYIWEE